MKQICLINMPFSVIYRPSIGLALLKAALERDGHEVSTQNFNLLFAELVGVPEYSEIADIPASLIGEWIFARALDEANPNEGKFLASFDREKHAALIDRICAMALKAPSFIKECFDSVDWSQYDVIGFTSTFEQTAASLALAKVIKRNHPDVLIAFGGANAEGEMGRTLLNAFDCVDAVCSGEGDIAFPAFINGLDKGQDDVVPGMMRRDQQSSALNAKSVYDMNSLPIPNYDEFFEQFSRMSYADSEMSKVEIPFESSRGCWWGAKSHCKFCGLNGSGMAFRSKTADCVQSELALLGERYGKYTRRFFAVDNIIDYKYFDTLLPELRDKGVKLDIFYETKANLSREKVQLMRDAGIRKIQPGIESLSTEVLQLMGKGVSALQNVQLLKYCREMGVKPLWNIIYGFPGEKDEHYEQSAQLIPALSHLEPPSNLTLIRLDRFSPYYEQSEEHGLKNVRPFDQYGYVFHTLTEEQLAGIAYYFKFDYAENGISLEPVRALNDKVEWWKSVANKEFLICDTRGENLFIFNYRSGFKRQLFNFNGLKKDVYEILDKPRSKANLHERLSALGYEVTSEQISKILENMAVHGLVVSDRNTHLAVAVKLGNYEPPQAVLQAFEQVIEKWQEKSRLKADKVYSESPI